MEATDKIFIDENKINELIELTPSQDKINEILNKALSLKGLDFKDAAMLLNVNDRENLEKIFHTAREVKEKIYGKRIVLFAPLYLSNYCSNNCLYCGFRHDNKAIKRKMLTVDEVI